MMTYSTHPANQPYSSIICSPAHPANQPQPTPRCCFDAYTKKDHILCAGCYKRTSQPVVDDDWDEYSPTVQVKPQPAIRHHLANDYEGPL